MAPKRGGGGSRGGSSVSSCPGAFSSTVEQVSFACDVVFFAVFLGISLAYCSMRKKAAGGGKKILGVPYFLALLLWLLNFALSIIATVLQQCGTTSFYSYYQWLIPINLFYYLGIYLLLVVVVYIVNTVLREQLGHGPTVIKIILLAITGVMGALTCAIIGLTCYGAWTQTEDGQEQDADPLLYPQARFRVAYYTLYLVSILASGGLALMTILSLRAKRNRAGDLIGWVIALTISMVLFILIAIVFAASYLEEQSMEWETSISLSYILNFAQALSFIFLLCIAKHVAWSKPVDTTTGPDMYAGVVPQQQYAYNANPNGQMYNYQQAPVYSGAVNPIKA